MVFDIGLDEERHADARILEFGDERLERLGAASNVETALRRSLFAPLRHETAGIRHMADRDLQHLSVAAISRLSGRVSSFLSRVISVSEM